MDPLSQARTNEVKAAEVSQSATERRHSKELKTLADSQRNHSKLDEVKHNEQLQPAQPVDAFVRSILPEDFIVLLPGVERFVDRTHEAGSGTVPRRDDPGLAMYQRGCCPIDNPDLHFRLAIGIAGGE